MPVGIEQRRTAHGVQPLALGALEHEVGGAQVVGELLGGARPDDHRADRGLAERVGQRDLGRGDAPCLRDLHQHFDHVIESVLVVDRRLVPIGEVARSGGGLLPASVLAGKQAAGQRAPDQDAQALVNRERNQLVLGLPSLQGVVDLLGHEPREPVALGDAQGLHQVPGGEVRGADIAHLAVADQVIQRRQRLLQRRQTVPLVHLVEVDVIGPEPAQAGFARGDDVVTGQPGVVGPLTHGEAHLGREQHVIAPAGDGGCLPNHYYAVEERFRN